MEKDLDFIFIKSRGIGDLISDYLSLFKRIFRHFNKSIFKFILPFLAFFLLFFFFVTSFGVNAFYSADWQPSLSFSLLITGSILVFFFYFLFIPTFGIEYMFLLQEKGSMDFSGADVWKRVKQHFGKYIVYFFASLLVLLILVIPVGLVNVLLLLIPVVGPIAMGILTTCITLAFSCGLFLYLYKKETPVFDCFTGAYKLLKKKLLAYGLSAYLFQMMLMICLTLITTIPAIILGIIAYNFIGFNEHFFVSFGGKMIVSIGGTLFILLTTISSIYVVAFYTLVYFSSQEATNKEGTHNQIEQIGNQDQKDEEF